jgi:SPP1 family predicted phage head-tail adaptor
MVKCGENIVSRLRHRVTIEEVTQATDGQGGFTETWAEIGKAWADIKPMKAYERFQAAQFEVPVSHKITMRYRSDLTEKHRLIYDSRVLEIKGIINENEDSAFLIIAALEKA